MNNLSIFLSVIIPAYNEEKRIGATLLSLDNFFAIRNYSYEVIIVNDGSCDNTAEVVSNWCNAHPHFFLINNKINKGKGYAVKCGMLCSRGKFKLSMDADNSVSIEHLDDFLKYCQQGYDYDIVIGSIELPGAIIKESGKWYGRFFGHLAKQFIRRAILPDIYDSQRGFKLFSQKASEKIFPRQTINRFGFDIELLVIAKHLGFKIKELPVKWINPAGSSVNFWSYFITLIELFKIKLKITNGKYQ